jgi:WD40 repeat protein/tetratricopeptide (TPR) repeat protein
VAFSPDAKTVLTGCYDNMARLWDAESAQPAGPPLAHQHAVRAVAFSPDGKAVLTGSQDNTARLWDAGTGKPIGPPLTHQGSVAAVAFSPDGKVVLTGSDDNTARLWDATNGMPIGPPLAHPGRGLHLGSVRAVAFSPDGKAVLTGSSDHTARLWDAATGMPIGPLLAHQYIVRSVAFSPDGNIAVTGCWDGTARLWDALTSKPIGHPIDQHASVTAVAFSPDGKTLLTGCVDNTARLWNIATAMQIGPPLEHKGDVEAVAFSPDGKVVLTGSDDNTARLWHVASREPIGPPLEHKGAVRAVSFSPDGRAALTRDGKFAWLWDIATGKPIGPPLAHGTRVEATAFSPDGKAVITGSDDKTARVWTITQLPNDLPRLKTWVELVTGLELDGRGAVQNLDNSAWRQRCERLGREGGPPDTGKSWRLDPILFGSEPTARARSWIERGRWAEAETAFDEVVRARPLDGDILLERARFHAARSQPAKADDDFVHAYVLRSRSPELIDTIVREEALFDRVLVQVPDVAATLWSERGDHHARSQRWAQAAADYGHAVRLQPEDLTHRQHQVLSHATAGNLYELRRVLSDFHDRFGQTTSPRKANDAARVANLASGFDAHIEPLVRVSELAVIDAPDAESKGLCLTTLGAALYRAGRFEEAIRRLEEGIQLRNGASYPRDWVFLAMAHHRLGHRDQARPYLERLRSRQPSTAPYQFWDEIEIRLLRSEAEATILYDPIFPANPFGR